MGLTIRPIQTIADLPANPIEQFHEWFTAAEQLLLPQHNAFTLSTVNQHAAPTARMVLLKDYSDTGFTFYTNCRSKKARDIANNPQVSMLFYWPQLERQIRIMGIASQVPREISEQYFATRSRESQIGAWVSKQSASLKDTKTLNEEFLQMQQHFAADANIPCPKDWGGYCIKPSYFEFWINKPNRLHDRFCYYQTSTTADSKTVTTVSSAWQIQQLYP